MRTEFYKSDFSFILPFVVGGVPMDLPESDWTAVLYTREDRPGFEVSYRNGVLTNCYMNGDKLYVVMNNHGLSAGRLKCRLMLEMADKKYEDVKRVVESEYDVYIELTGDGQWQPSGGSGGAARVNRRAEIDAAAMRGVQRGMISLGAQPGVLYRNLGFIRVKGFGETMHEGSWRVPHVIDVSAADPELIVDAYARRCGGNHSWDNGRDLLALALSSDKKKLETPALESDEVAVRLRTDRSKYAYLMKFSDGVIRGVNLGYEPRERGGDNRIDRPTRMLFRGGGNGLITVLKHLGITTRRDLPYTSFLMETPGGWLRVEVEYKGRINRSSEHHVRWMRNIRTHTKEGDYVGTNCSGEPTETLKRKRLGVARIRIAGRGRRMVGPWFTFSFANKPDSKIHVVQI